MREISRSPKKAFQERGHNNQQRIRFFFLRVTPDLTHLPSHLSSFWGKISLKKSLLTVENMPFRTWNQHTPFLCHNHAHREEFTVWIWQSSAVHWNIGNSGSINSDMETHSLVSLSFSSENPPILVKPTCYLTAERDWPSLEVRDADGYSSTCWA